MADSGQGARVIVSYAPYDEVLETAFWIGCVDAAPTTLLGHSHDEIAASQGTYMQQVADRIADLLTTNGRVVGITITEVDTRKARKNTVIYDQPGTQAGDPLPNNTYLYLQRLGLTSVGGGGEPPFTIRNAMKISGMPISAQNNGRWDQGFLDTEVAALITRLNNPYTQTSGAQVAAQVRGGSPVVRKAKQDSAIATPVVGRDKTRTGNVAQRRGVIVP